jgi:gliding motility associated protien GldN
MKRELIKSMTIFILLFCIRVGQCQDVKGDTTLPPKPKPPPPPPGYVQDRPYPMDDSNAKFVPYTHLRQADVMWSQRIWRIMDLREKMNFSFYYTMTRNQNRIAFWDILKDAVKNGELTVYEDNSLIDLDLTFVVPLTKAKIMGIIEPVDSGMTDENGNAIPPVPQPVTPDKIRGYMLKEDWFFDKQRSIMDVRILGIAPMEIPINKNTKQEDTTAGLSPLFWIYFPQLRPLLISHKVFNSHNIAQCLTYDAIFWKRQFSSFIFQESNVYNRPVVAYEGIGIDRLLEGEKIKKRMFDIEHDMWQY